jgi:hypothetical protein
VYAAFSYCAEGKSRTERDKSLHDASESEQVAY